MPHIRLLLDHLLQLAAEQPSSAPVIPLTITVTSSPSDFTSWTHILWHTAQDANHVDALQHVLRCPLDHTPGWEWPLHTRHQGRRGMVVKLLAEDVNEYIETLQRFTTQVYSAQSCCMRSNGQGPRQVGISLEMICTPTDMQHI